MLPGYRLTGRILDRASPEYLETSLRVEKEFPELWGKCYPRRYDETGRTQYDSPKTIARAMMDALLNYHVAEASQTEQAEALWASVMAKYRVPTYYLTHDMGVALSQTTPKQVIDWVPMKLPFPAGAFVLPKGLLTHPDEGWLSFIGYHRCFVGDNYLCPHPDPRVKHLLDIMSDQFCVVARTSNGWTLHWTFTNDSFRLIDFTSDDEMITQQRGLDHTSRELPISGVPPRFMSTKFNDTDTRVMAKAIKFLFNVLLLITAKPETVDPAKLLKKVFKGAEKVEYWKPHIIGSGYKLKHEKHTPTGTHASPRGHWVSGFWRDQHYGTSRSLVKTIWIEPFWRGGEI